MIPTPETMFCLPISFLLTLFFLAPAVLPAQQYADSEAVNLNLTWRAISFDATLRNLYFADASGEQPVFVPNADFSKAYTYVGPTPLVLFEKEESEAGFRRIPIVSIPLPLDARDARIFFQGSQSPGDLEAYAVSGDLSTQRPGHSRLINVTGFEIAGLHDGEEFRLAPGETVLLPFRADNDGPIKVSIKLAAREPEGTWRRQIESNYGATSDMHVTLLFRGDGPNNVRMIPLRQQIRSGDP